MREPWMRIERAFGVAESGRDYDRDGYRVYVYAVRNDINWMCSWTISEATVHRLFSRAGGETAIAHMLLELQAQAEEFITRPYAEAIAQRDKDIAKEKRHNEELAGMK